MNERANTYNAKAEAARTKRKLARAQSRRRVMVSSFALFALVFTLLSFRLTTGLDPSTGNTVATTNAASSTSTTVESDSSSEPADDDTSSSAGSTTSSQITSQNNSVAPTTRAS